MNTATGLLFTDLDAILITDDGLKRRLRKVKHFLIRLEPSNYHDYEADYSIIILFHETSLKYSCNHGYHFN